MGADARIGANAVVVHDVPPGASAVGVPAKVRFPRAPVDEYADDPAIYI